MALPEPFAEAILNELRSLPFRMSVDGKAVHVKGVRAARLPLHFRVTGSMRGLTVTAHIPREFHPASYLWQGREIDRIWKVLKIHRKYCS